MPERVLKLLLDLLDPSGLVPEDAAYIEIDERIARRMVQLKSLLVRERLAEVCLSSSAEVFGRDDLAEALEIDPGAWEGQLCDQPYIRLPDDLVLPADLDLARVELVELCVRHKFVCWKFYIRDIEHVIESREIPLAVFEGFLLEGAPSQDQRKGSA